MTDPNLNNRIHNSSNRFQGVTQKVLCVCSAGLLRSPTAAVVLSQPPFNYNTRAAGIVPQFALIPVDEVLLHWADTIVCMSAEQAITLEEMCKAANLAPKIHNLDIPDSFMYRDPDLMDMIYSRCVEANV